VIEDDLGEKKLRMTLDCVIFSYHSCRFECNVIFGDWKNINALTIIMEEGIAVVEETYMRYLPMWGIFHHCIVGIS
jgi:hypothetical protein